LYPKQTSQLLHYSRIKNKQYDNTTKISKSAHQIIQKVLKKESQKAHRVAHGVNNLPEVVTVYKIHNVLIPANISHL